MNFTYDIYLNFNDTIYDFFEWKKSDFITRIKKIPIFKISSFELKKIVGYSFSIDKDLFNYIYCKTETYSKKSRLDSCALFSDENNVIAVKFNNLGKSIKKSFLNISEELDILEETIKMKPQKINLKLLKKENICFKTRNEIEKEEFINDELKNMDIERLKYVFYECYSVKETNKDIIINKLKKIKNNNEKYKNLYNILNLTSSTKNKMV